MRILLPMLLFIAPLPAAAQAPSAAPPTAVMEALRTHFPEDHAVMAKALAGKRPAEARPLAYAALERFFTDRSAAILAAPGSMLIALEARHGALLRAIERQDARLCAKVGDRGFFSPEALAVAPLPALEAYGVALVEATRAGVPQQAAAAPQPASDDLLSWLKEVERIVPDVPVRAMLADPARRASAPPEHLCRGAVAMHEAVAALPPTSAERMSRMLLRAVIHRPR